MFQHNCCATNSSTSNASINRVCHAHTVHNSTFCVKDFGEFSDMVWIRNKKACAKAQTELLHAMNNATDGLNYLPHIIDHNYNAIRDITPNKRRPQCTLIYVPYKYDSFNVIRSHSRPYWLCGEWVIIIIMLCTGHLSQQLFFDRRNNSSQLVVYHTHTFWIKQPTRRLHEIFTIRTA